MLSEHVRSTMCDTVSHAKYAVEKAILSSNARIVLAAPHTTRHIPICTPDILSFTIYPTRRADIAQNEFLWHLVRDSTFAISDGRKFLSRRLAVTHPQLAGTPATLFAVVLPEPLAAFLEAVSLKEMHRSIVYMLADTAHGADQASIRNMRDALTPPVWTSMKKLLLRSARQFSNGLGIACTDGSLMLDVALRSAYDNDYWRIDVDAGVYVPPRHVAYSIIRSDSLAAAVLASMHTDWATYTANELVWDTALPDGSREDECRARDRRRVARETMMRLIREGRQKEIWDRVNALRQCTENQKSLFSRLPTQIVEHLLVPRVVMDYDDDYDDEDEYEYFKDDECDDDEDAMYPYDEQYSDDEEEGDEDDMYEQQLDYVGYDVTPEALMNLVQSP